jgi:MmyB-like transcription regulator ligand binding domain
MHPACFDNRGNPPSGSSSYQIDADDPACANNKCPVLFRGDHILRPSGEVFLRDLVEELTDTDADFCRWWAEHEVLKRSDWRKVIQHSVVDQGR